MGKKIKRNKTSMPMPDPNLEDVGEDRAMEMELDEETKEIVLVHHYRHKWGDEMDADVEHIMSIAETEDLIGMLITGIEELKKLMIQERDEYLKTVEKKTPEVVEGNPLKEIKKTDGE